MRQLFIPILLIALSVLVFFGFIDSRYQEIKELKVEMSKYDEALNKSKELLSLRDKLLSRYNTLATSDLERINNLLPTNVDNVHLILEINNIAAENDLMVKNISIKKAGEEDIDKENQNKEINNLSSKQSSVFNSIDIIFSVNTDYESFKSFLKDLEKSLRLIDVTQISFTSENTAFKKYKVGIRTYWLR